MFLWDAQAERWKIRVFSSCLILCSLLSAALLYSKDKNNQKAKDSKAVIKSGTPPKPVKKEETNREQSSLSRSSFSIITDRYPINPNQDQSYDRIYFNKNKYLNNTLGAFEPSDSSVQHYTRSNITLADYSGLPPWLSHLNTLTPADTEKDSAIVVRDVRQISRVIHSHNEEIESCYQRHLRRDPDIKGKLILRITIDAQGAVEKVETTFTTVNDNLFHREILEIIKKWDDFGRCSQSSLKVYRQQYVFGD
jgi:hypothetical protein